MCKVRCTEHNAVVAEKVEPCPEYPHGAIRLLDKHHGKRCETVIPLSGAAQSLVKKVLKVEHGAQPQATI